MHHRLFCIASIIIASISSAHLMAGEVPPEHEIGRRSPAASPDVLEMFASYRVLRAEDQRYLKSKLDESLDTDQERQGFPPELIEIIAEYAKPQPITVINNRQPDTRPSHESVDLVVGVCVGGKNQLLKPQEQYPMPGVWDTKDQVCRISFVCDREGSLAYIDVPIEPRTLFEETTLEVLRNDKNEIIVTKSVLVLAPSQSGDAPHKKNVVYDRIIKDAAPQN